MTGEIDIHHDAPMEMTDESLTLVRSGIPAAFIMQVCKQSRMNQGELFLLDVER